MNKGVSARDMSLSIGQSEGYINNIENGVNFPSMTVFFYICDYFGITTDELITGSQNIVEQKKEDKKNKFAIPKQNDERADKQKCVEKRTGETCRGAGD